MPSLIDLKDFVDLKDFAAEQPWTRPSYGSVSPADSISLPTTLPDSPVHGGSC